MCTRQGKKTQHMYCLIQCSYNTAKILRMSAAKQKMADLCNNCKPCRAWHDLFNTNFMVRPAIETQIIQKRLFKLF